MFEFIVTAMDFDLEISSRTGRNLISFLLLHADHIHMPFLSTKILVCLSVPLSPVHLRRVHRGPPRARTDEVLAHFLRRLRGPSAGLSEMSRHAATA